MTLHILLNDHMNIKFNLLLSDVNIYNYVILHFVFYVKINIYVIVIQSKTCK